MTEDRPDATAPDPEDSSLPQQPQEEAQPEDWENDPASNPQDPELKRLKGG